MTKRKPEVTIEKADREEELGTDVVNLIFRFCDYQTVLNFKLVSKKYSKFANDQVLWKTLTFKHLKEVNIDGPNLKRPIEVKMTFYNSEYSLKITNY